MADKKEIKSLFRVVEDYLSATYDFQYNEISNRHEYKEKDSKRWQALNENNIYRELQHQNFNFSLNNIVALMKSDFVPKYNPFINYFESLPKWDGTDHILSFSSYIKVKERERFDKHFKKMFVRTIACATNDKVFNKQALIFVHPVQNSGKSTLCRFLVPNQLADYVTENINTDKDSLISLCENLIIVLDELATLTKVEINGLKSIFSKETVKVRRPYERRPDMIPRRASFIGSTNKMEFLNDETGSVRWLCFELDSIDWNYSKNVDIDKVWGQAYSLYKDGFKYELTPEEITENETANRKYQVSTPEMELIQKYITPGTKEKHDEFWSSTDIVTYLTAKCDRSIKLNVIQMGKALSVLGFNREQKYNGVYQEKGYYLSYLLKGG